METRSLYNETDILINYEYQLAHETWHNIYDMLANLCIELFPHLGEIEADRSQYQVFEALLDIMVEVDVQSRSAGWDGESSVTWWSEHIKQYLADSDMISLSRCFVVISDVTDTGEIFLDREWSTILSSSWGIPMIEYPHLLKEKKSQGKQYLNIRSENPDTQQQQFKSNVENDVTKAVEYIKPRKYTFRSVATSLAEGRLEQVWKSIVTDDFDCQYLWRNKIDRATYQELQNRIKECAYEQRADFSERYALVLAFYVAEWYKRDYNGNGKLNPLKELRLKGNTSSDIWKHSGLPLQLLYKKSNYLYLDSLYLLGGFPLNYLIKKQFDKVFKEIATIFQKDNSDKNLEKNIYINNYALKQSIGTPWGSLHLYFESIKKGSYPFADSDCEEEPFRTFIKGLNDWNPLRKKFSFEWIVAANLQTPVMRRSLRVHLSPEDEGTRHRSISYNRLAHWGIDCRLHKFDVYLCFDEDDPLDIPEDAEHFTFINSHDGFFVAKTLHPYLTYHDFPTGNISKIRLVALAGYSYKILQTWELESYLQLYQTDRYNIFSSQKSYRTTYAILPYVTKIIYPADVEADKKYFSLHADSFKMIEIIDKLVFIDSDEKETTLFNHENGINLLFTRLDNTIQYLPDGGLLYHEYDENGELQTQSVPMVSNYSDMTVVSYAENCVPVKIGKNDYKVEFKGSDDTNYHIWNNENQPQQGMHRLRVSALGCQKFVNVYVLPQSKKPFARDIQQGQILLDSQIKILSSPGKLQPSTKKDYLCYEDKMKPSKNEDCVQFEIGNENAYIEVSIYRPFNFTELYCDSTKIENISPNQYDQIRVDIPFIFKDHYSVRQIDNQGVHHIDFKNIPVSWLDFCLEDDADSINSSYRYEISHGIVKFYIAKKMSCSDVVKIINGKNSDSYHLYYWSMQVNDDPVRLTVQNYTKILEESQNKHKGLFFQSLENGLCTKSYFAPVINGAWKGNDDTNLALACFKIAARHKIPFRLFAPIFELLKDTDSRLVDFAAVNLYEQENDYDEILLQLIRLSNELYFSWPMLNRKTWLDMPSRMAHLFQNEVAFTDRDKFKNHFRNLAKKLFLACGENFSIENRNSLRDFTENYWLKCKTMNSFPGLSDHRWFGRASDGSFLWDDRSNELPVRAVCFMRARPANGYIRIYTEEKGKGYYKTIRNRIYGFTKEEYSNQEETGSSFRDLETILSFLKQLESDTESFVHIEKFIRLRICRNI